MELALCIGVNIWDETGRETTRMNLARWSGEQSALQASAGGGSLARLNEVK